MSNWLIWFAGHFMRAKASGGYEIFIVFYRTLQLYILHMVKEQSIYGTAISMVKSGEDAEAVIAKVCELCGSANGCMVMITKIRKELHDERYGGIYDEVADGLIRSDLYKETRAKAAEEMEASLIAREDVEYDIPEFRREALVASLAALMEQIRNGEALMSYYTLTLCMLNFSSRPAELYHLYLRDGCIGGHVKQRGKDQVYPYEGIVSYDDAVVLLAWMQGYPEYDIGNLKNMRHITLYRTYLKLQYGITPRVLRMLGSMACAEKDTSRVLRRKTQRNALRHKFVDTSIVHYGGC